MNPLNYSFVEQKIRVVREKNVILDVDVAHLYGVQTKHVNQAVKNNPEKFPPGYVIELDDAEWNDLRSKFLTANRSTLFPPALLHNPEETSQDCF